MIDHLLTDKELDLVLELLEAESRRLLTTTRHTDTRSMRQSIQKRERTVDRLIERFHEIKVGDYNVPR